jgi:hypothetical protein
VGGGLIRRWDMAAAWDAAVHVCASAYGLDEEGLRAKSRGRGPRPAERVWQPKKIAVHLTVAIAECGYAALGRLVGLHKDTIASHCASVRAECAGDAALEAFVHTLEDEVKTQLRLNARRELLASRARAAQLEREIAEIDGDLVNPTLHPTLSGALIRPENSAHENVIVLDATRKPRA